MKQSNSMLVSVDSKGGVTRPFLWGKQIEFKKKENYTKQENQKN